VGEELIPRSEFEAWLRSVARSDKVDPPRFERCVAMLEKRFRARYKAITVCAEGYVVSDCGSARPNGVPSESRHTDQASPGWITPPPSASTRWSASAMSLTSK